MTLKFGIIGCGAIAHAHLAAIRALPDAELVACCDIDARKGAAFAAEAGQVAFFTDYRALLATPVDVVTIATPHVWHAEMTIASLQSGKHVICEKPMALSPREAAAVAQAATASRTQYAVCFQNRFNPTYVAAAHLLHSGDLGQLRGVKAELTWRRDAQYYAAADWKGRWATEGGGVLVNQAIHTLDALCWLAATPTRVCARIMTSRLLGAIEVEDAAMVTAELPGQVPAVIFASNNYSSDPAPTLTFDCTGGVLALSMDTLRVNDHVVDHRTLGPIDGGKPAWGSGHSRLFAAFAHRIQGGTDPLDGHLVGCAAQNTVALLAAIYRSSASGDWVAV
ncbi:Gfo/Idh/MocA family protein [Lacticaseibacillus absianus]|uniref:Gfo/Idh/MocA family protein n=1 Tax=Lacticaseibacillus absianus TaxID=2729623 RepID=UPI0015CDB0D6|nr:Gfo/Idh/MocA family oxidoreductase [Lacticaseibacillus absianus]